MWARKITAIMLLLVWCSFGAGSGSGGAAGQGSLGQLKSWAGRYPTHKTGRMTRNFFQLPEIRRPLQKLLDRRDLNLLTREYKVETPIKRVGDYLAVKVCRPHVCDSEQAGMAINLSDGRVFVRMGDGSGPRWLSSTGQMDGLPQSVRDYLDDFSAT